MSTKEKERQGLLEHALSKDKFLRVESAPGGEPCSLPPTVQPSSHREGHVSDRGAGARPASRSAGVPTSTADPLPAALGQSLPQRPALLQAPLTLLLEGELAVDRPRHHVAATVLGVRQRLRSAARSFHDLRAGGGPGGRWWSKEGEETVKRKLQGEATAGQQPPDPTCCSGSWGACTSRSRPGRSGPLPHGARHQLKGHLKTSCPVVCTCFPWLPNSEESEPRVRGFGSSTQSVLCQQSGRCPRSEISPDPGWDPGQGKGWKGTSTALLPPRTGLRAQPQAHTGEKHSPRPVVGPPVNPPGPRLCALQADSGRGPPLSWGQNFGGVGQISCTGLFF